MLLQKQQELESKYVMNTYKRKPVAFVRGNGMRLYDDSGREYLDFISGFGAISVGHGNARVVAAIQEQAAKLLHVSNYYYVEGRAQLAQKLSKLLGEGANEDAGEGGNAAVGNSALGDASAVVGNGAATGTSAPTDNSAATGTPAPIGSNAPTDAPAATDNSAATGAPAATGNSAENRTSSTWKTFFANSGAEAIEGAIKIARKYGVKHLQGADTVVCARRSFHGRTLAALAATGQPSKQESFAPLPEGFKHVDLNDIAALKQALNPGVGGANVCAVLLECVQGEGGVYPATFEYLQAARELTAAKGILLMIDEVQTGFYRTGTYPFAFQHSHIAPDVVAMAKGIGNGVPMGAVAACGVAAEVLEPGDHGSTFGGSPLVVAAANATLDELARMNIGVQVAQTGAYLAESLATLPGVKEVRGRGLMMGAEFEQAIAEQVVNVALEQGLLLNSIGHHIVRVLPPLVCTNTEIDILITQLRDICLAAIKEFV